MLSGTGSGKDGRSREKRPSGKAERTLTFQQQTLGILELLRVFHFRGRRLDFLKLGKRAKAGWLDFTGAAAGRGQQREGGSDKGRKNSDHGKLVGKGFEEKGFPARIHAGNPGKSLGGSHVSGLARGGSGAWAAGSGEKSGGSGNEGKFHEYWMSWFLMDASMKSMPVSSETNGGVHPCKAKVYRQKSVRQLGIHCLRAAARPSILGPADRGHFAIPE